MPDLARYIYISTSDYLNLAEVQAFDAYGRLLTARSASMSSTNGNNYASNCIDGRTSNGQNCGRGHSCCHTNQGGWLRIDYGKPVAINSIKVFPP